MDSRILTPLLLVAVATGCLGAPYTFCPNQNYEAGRTTRYLLSSSVQRGVTFMGFQCILDVTSSPQCETTIQFSQCQALGTGSEFNEGFLTSTKSQLERFPMIVRFEENGVGQIEAASGDSGDILNVKRSVLWALQTYSLPIGYHRLMQSTVLGTCTSKISVSDRLTSAEIEPETCESPATGVHPLVAAVLGPNAAGGATAVSSVCRQRWTSSTALSSTQCQQTYLVATSHGTHGNYAQSAAPPTAQLSIDLQFRSSGVASSFPQLTTPSYPISLPYSTNGKLAPTKAHNNNVLVPDNNIFHGIVHWFSAMWHQLTGSPDAQIHALLFADQRIYTFGGRMLQMPAERRYACTYLLSKNVVHHNLTILATADSVTVITSEISVTIETSGKIRLNNSMSYSHTPVESWNAAVHVSRSDDVVSLTSVYGVTVWYNLAQRFYVFSLPAWYNSQIQGLLGQADDTGDYADNTPAAELLQSYEVTGRRQCQRAPNASHRRHQSLRRGAQSDVCRTLFSSELSACRQTVNPQSFISACQGSTYPNPKQAVCEVAAAYMSLCSTRGVSMPASIRGC